MSLESYAVIGYGTQGRAQALNLKDSDAQVTIGLRTKSKSWSLAISDGLQVETISKAVQHSSIIVLLTPDCTHSQIWKEQILPFIQPGSALIVAHGFSLYNKQLIPTDACDVLLIAPHAIGDEIRIAYLEDRGVPVQVSVIQDISGVAQQRLEQYCQLQKFDKAGLVPITLREEVIIDLFAEQTVLVGGIMILAKTAFETLIAKGYNQDSAYLSCLYELKAIIDVILKVGPEAFLHKVSDTALFGATSRAPRILNRTEFDRILADIENGQFTHELVNTSDDEKTQLVRDLQNELLNELWRKWKR